MHLCVGTLCDIIVFMLSLYFSIVLVIGIRFSVAFVGHLDESKNAE